MTVDGDGHRGISIPSPRRRPIHRMRTISFGARGPPQPVPLRARCGWAPLDIDLRIDAVGNFVSTVTGTERWG